MKKLLLILSAALCCASLQAAQSGNQSESYQYYLRSVIKEGEGNVSGAEEDLDKALELAPDSAYLYYSLADLAFRQNQLPKASEAIENAISLDPQKIKAYILAGQIYWAMGDQEKAEARLKKAVQLDPDEADALVNLAITITPKEPRQAVKLYEDYLSRHPGELEIQERVAQLYSTIGDMDKAKEAWSKALDISPESIRAHLASAQIAEVQHDTATAVDHYEAVLEQDPNNLPLLLRVGELQYRNDKMAKAYEAFSRAQSLAPDSPSANFWLALVSESRGDWEQAIRLLKAVADKAPEPGILLRLSYYYAQNGQQKEAIDVLKKLSDQDPENTDFLRYLAVGYEQNKQFDKAIKIVNRLLEIDPHNPDHYFHLATLYDRTKQFPKAEAALKKSIDLDPQFHMALNYLGYTYAERNIKLDEAEKLLQTAVSLDPTNSAYLDSLGWIYFKKGDLKRAEDFLTEATKEGKDPLIWEHMGDVQMSLGQTQTAIESWQTSLRFDPKQTGVTGKIEKAFQKVPTDQKMLLLFNRARADQAATASIKGLVEISLGTKKPSYQTRAQLGYDKNSSFSIQTPGPLGVPLFLISKSSDGPVQYGAVHPALQSVESEAVLAFERIESLLSGSLLSKMDPTSLAKTATASGSHIQSALNGTELTFDIKSGHLSQVKWDNAGKVDILTIGDFSKTTAPAIPLEFEWKDLQNQFIFHLKLIHPLVSSALFIETEDDDEQ